MPETETCSYCFTTFTPIGNSNGDLEYTDDHGAVCCDSCLCRPCGHGHPTAAERAACAATFEVDERESPDPDSLTAIARDRLVEV